MFNKHNLTTLTEDKEIYFKIGGAHGKYRKYEKTVSIYNSVLK